MRRVYIAHPLMGTPGTPWGDPEANVTRYLEFCAWLSRAGYAVVSWAHHYELRQRGMVVEPAEFYLKRDRALIGAADWMLVAGPAVLSAGLRYELEAARDFQKGVLYAPEWCDFAWRPDPTAPFWIDGAAPRRVVACEAFPAVQQDGVERRDRATYRVTLV